MGERRRRATKDEILAQIRTQTAAPFEELLADFLRAKPDQKSINAAAKRSPDRFMQGVTQAAKLAGLAGPDVEINIGGLRGLAVRLERMSDSEFKAAKLEYERTRTLPALSPELPEPPGPAPRARSF